MERSALGYDIDRVEAWIASNVAELRPPLTWSRLPGGHSNLTYLLEDGDGHRAVIRRPPLGELLPTAHDMRREWALITALGPTPVPVARAIAFCDDVDVTGARFYLMEHVRGHPLYSIDDTRRYIPEDRRAPLAHSFIDVLAELHALDPDEVGLGALGKKEDYVRRQLNTWYRSWCASVEPARFDDPRAHSLQQYFLANVPEQGPARIAHGDYSVRNCLCTETGEIAAVLDWEISTLGDPLADLAYTLNEWPDPGDPLGVLPDAPTQAPGFPTRRELAQRYAERSGRDVSRLDYYAAFNRWKSAAIGHGVYARYMEGKKSAEGVRLDELRANIERLLALAEEAVRRLESQ